MDKAVAEAVLAEMARRVQHRTILWRGPDLNGSDVDLLVLPSAEKPVRELLSSAGLLPAEEAGGRTVWSAPDGSLVVDVLPASAWPPYYPSVVGLVARARHVDGLPPVASEEDLLLIHAVDAVRGRPLDKVATRARALLQSTGRHHRLRAVAAAEGMAALAALVSDPERLASLGRRGRLPYIRASLSALRSRRGRAALSARVSGRLGGTGGSQGADSKLRGVAGAPLRRRGAHGHLVTLSGMDGAGKSTAAQTAKTHLEAVGVAVGEIVWGRVDHQGAVLDKIAVPIKRLLGVGTTLADPVATGGPTVAKQRAPAASWVRRLGLAWLWTAVVAAINARSQRLAARPRLGGTTILCDRWLVDSLVDLRVRYGRHRLAEWILRVASPAPDLAILIEVGHITAAQRKPGDQATRVLVAMEGLYAAAAERHGLVKVDARVASETVQDQIRALIDALLASH